MSIERLPDPLDVLVIKDAFNDERTVSIKSEVRNLLRKDEGQGIWISEAYNDVSLSVVGESVMELMFNDRVVEALENMNSMYGLYRHVNNHSTVIRYYGHEQESLLRSDNAVFTVMTFLCDEPKKFEGGELILQMGSDVAYQQSIENDTTVIFPSSYYVGLSKVEAKSEEVTDPGLYVVTSYLFIESR